MITSVTELMGALEMVKDGKQVQIGNFRSNFKLKG